MPITEAQAMAALPPHGFVRNYVDYACRLTDAPTAYHIGVGLTILASVVPPGLRVTTYGSSLYTPIWMMLVGRSYEERKTHSIELGRSPLQEAFPRRVGPMPRSSEGLITSLQQHTQQDIVYPEFGEFLQKTANDSSYAAALRTIYNAIYDCPSEYRVRAVRSIYSVRDPRMCLLAGSTPQYVEEWTSPTDWEGGFMSRWCILYAIRERSLDLGGLQYPGERLKLIDELKAIPDLKYWSCKGFERQAQRAYAAWRREIRARYENRVSHWTVGAIGRGLGALTCKVATLFGFDFGAATEGGEWEIGMEQLIPAMRFAEMHIQSVVELAENIASNQHERRRRAVLRGVQGGAFNLGQLLERVRPRMNKRDIMAVIDALTEGKVMWQFQPTSGSSEVRFTSDVNLIPDVVPFQADAGGLRGQAQQPAGLLPTPPIQQARSPALDVSAPEPSDDDSQ